MDQLVRITYWLGLISAVAAGVMRLVHYAVPVLNGMTHVFFYRGAVLLLLVAAATAAYRSLESSKAEAPSE